MDVARNTTRSRITNNSFKIWLSRFYPSALSQLSWVTLITSRWLPEFLGGLYLSRFKTSRRKGKLGRLCLSQHFQWVLWVTLIKLASGLNNVQKNKKIWLTWARPYVKFRGKPCRQNWEKSSFLNSFNEYYVIKKKLNNAICSNKVGPRDCHTKVSQKDKLHMISFICGIFKKW